ncbi:hypothetical protein M5J20_05770 [Corynebacterium sp. TA-R-1]|uniref:Uncharacterized protein n=1 Tax=Corynebacterium stercoris TaxID=2943490 RepID=A0ABT1G108_9CORY|nr:hypothetical protein [Corynebacterium stercoris]MCP1387696.1 hypothetical protein [Corynebacterium stercoris]
MRDKMGEAFAMLYPDVDPGTPLPPSTWERAAIAVSSGVLFFGVAAGNLIVAGVGLFMVLAATIMPTQRTDRRVRNEARSRFPQMEWAEKQVSRQYESTTVIGVTWAAIAIVAVLALLLVPAKFSLVAAGVCGVAAAAIMWFVPGIHPSRQPEIAVYENGDDSLDVLRDTEETATFSRVEQ